MDTTRSQPIPNPTETGQPTVERGLVTVIVPAYRADRLIAGALESVARQRYAQWEVVVVEDGSDGDVRRCVEAFARQAAGHRVVYVRHEENRGLGATRNTAMEHARGEFLALLDADDIWLEGHLAAVLAVLEDQQADLAYSTVVKFEDGTNRLLGLWGPSPKDLAEFPAALVRRNFITPSATVLRRRVVEAVGRFDTDPGVHMCEDLDYWLRSVEAGMKFAHVPGCHCLYRKGAPGAGSGNLCNIVEHQAAVLKKHVGKAGIPAKVWQRGLVYYLTAAGVLNLEHDACRASKCFLDGWRAQTLRVDLLLLAVLAASVFRVVPVAWAVRWLKRRRGAIM